MAQIKQTGFSPGGKYTVQVRARSIDDPNRVSEWSNAFSFTTSNDTIAPKAPSALTMVSQGSSFIAKWTAPTENENNTPCTDLEGYWIRFKNTDNLTEQTREVFTKASEFTLDFNQNKEMFLGFAKGNLTIEVKSADKMGNRTTTPASTTASNPRPADVTGLVASDGIEQIILEWDKNTVDDDLVGYEVHMSTTGAGFTPGPSTLRFSGLGTSYVLPTGNPVPHYFRVRAVDVFALYSVNDATAVETPRTTTSTDGTPPDAPTNVVLSSTNDGERSTAKVTFTPAAATDVDHYVVRYGINTSDWSYVNVPSDVTEVFITNLKPGQTYYIGAKAIDYSANSSAWTNATVYPYTTAADSTAPNQPAAPTVNASVQKVQISHTMKDSSAVNLAADTDHLEVHVGTTAGFTPSSTTKIAEIQSTGQGIAVSTIVAYPTVDDAYWKVIAVDRSGNKSTASTGVQADPGLIENAYIADATISNAKINDLSAAKLIAGTAFVNDLFIQSKLTINNASGSIESDDYNAGSQLGWKIDRNGIYLYEGTIAAKALMIQDSQNLISAPFADFEFADRYYFNATNDPTTNISATAGIKFYKLLTSKFGGQSLRTQATVAAANKWVRLAPAGTLTIPLEADQTYIVSAYVRNQGAGATTADLRFDTDQPLSVVQNVSLPVSTNWVRVSLTITTNSATTRGAVFIGQVANTTMDVAWDGIQVERKIGALNTPSPWSPNGMTVINGESITTGTIQSSAPAVGIANQPAWSLNTTGGLQVGDALVRGNLTVGAGADTTTSMVKSSDYIAGTSGWQIRGDGDVEFNSGTFRGDLNIERVVSGLTTRLEASVGDQRIQTIVGTTPTPTTISTPALSGQHYGYTRTSNGAGWYLPTTPANSRKMRYFFGPSTDRSVVLQTNTKDVDAIYMGVNAENIPRNAQINSFQLGEIIDYKVSQAEKEATGFMHYSSGLEKTGTTAEAISYTYTHTPSGGTLIPNTENQSYISQQGITKQLSQFAPEYVGGTASKLTDYYSNSGWVVESANANTFTQLNLLGAPYDETYIDVLTFDGVETSNDLSGTTTDGMVNTTGTANNIHVTATVQPGMFDNNYKTPSWLINWSRVANSASTVWMTKNMIGTNPQAWTYPVTSIRRGKTYILSIFIKTDLPGSQTSGTLGPPATAFNLTMGLRCKGTGTTSPAGYYEISKTVTVQPGMSSQRVSVDVTPAAGSPELEGAIMFLTFPGFALLNRYVAVTHPQVEEKAWSIHSNPTIASSLLPTAWKPNQWTRQSTNKAGILVKTAAVPDFRYEAYGRNARGNQLYTNLNSYQVADYKAFREAPAYVDIYMLRDSRIYSGANTPYNGDQGSTKYRFSEAGLQFPTSFEPYMPAGVQAIYQTRNYLPASGGGVDGSLHITEHAFLATNGEVILGNDIRQYIPANSYIIDKAGFYVMFYSCRVMFSASDLMWFKWKVTNKDGTFDLSADAVGRNGVWETSTSCMRYLNRDDIISLFMYNASPTQHSIENGVLSIARIN